MRTDRLSPLEATSLMVGAGVGAGIMAIPWLVARTGLLELVVVLVAAYGATCLVHLLLAEVCIRTGEDLQLVELVRLYLLRDRRWIWVVWLAFVLLTVAFLAALASNAFDNSTSRLGSTRSEPSRQNVKPTATVQPKWRSGTMVEMPRMPKTPTVVSPPATSARPT